MQSFRRVVTILIVVFAVCCWAYTLFLTFTSSPEQRIQFVPDDAYYYLTLARNFVNYGQWSFDSGGSLTTGFHPLHAYALAAVYALTHPSAGLFVDYAIILSFALALPAILLAAYLAIRSNSLLPALVFLLLLTSRNVLLNTISVVEWSWVVSLSAVYCLIFWRAISSNRKLVFAALFVLGFFGSFARTDFGILPASLVLGALIVIRSAAGRVLVMAAVSGLVGAALGVLTVFCHNYLLTGQYLQSSARMKMLWMASYGPSLTPIMYKVSTLFGGEASRPTLLLVLFVLLAAAIFGVGQSWKLWFHSSIGSSGDLVPVMDIAASALWLGSLCAIVGYIVFYSLNPLGVQTWYTAGLVVPFFLFISLPFFNGHPSRLVYAAVLAVLLILVVRQAVGTYSFRDHPEWPHQVAMLRAGQYLQQHPVESRVGSWNAGIIGYYEGGHVINLDGLVNNDIYSYAKENDLPAYIDKMKIDYIVDFTNMFVSDENRRRGGYDSANFLLRLVPLRKFDERSTGWYGLTLYKVQAN